VLHRRHDWLFFRAGVAGVDSPGELMDFASSERAAALQKLARAFVDRELIPLEPLLAPEGWAGLEPRLAVVRARAKETGLFAPHMPEELGGAGLTLLEQAQLSEELGRSLFGHYAFNFAAPDVGNMELLAAFGSDEQKATWLAPLVRGELRSTFLMTEPEHAGSNPVWMSTRARRQGGAWVLRGHKWFATGADGAAVAIVMAETDPDAESRHARASMFAVPTDSEGFELVRNISVMGHAGEGWLSHGEVMLHGVRVAESALLGPAGAGFKLAQTRLGPGRIHHATRWIGVCQRALELLCTHAAERELAPGKTLGTRQTVQEWIADSRAEIEAARLLVLRAAWLIDRESAGQGEGAPGAHGHGTPASREAISLIKFHVAGVLQRVLDRAVQAHGALGMTDDTPLAFWYSHERAARIYDGPDEVHKRVVARGLLKRFGVKLGSSDSISASSLGEREPSR
jgi:acyl-CoA dehydrogenase